MDVATRLQEALEGRYSLVQQLGEGGMAIVYLADDLKHPRQVALKVLRPEISTAMGAARFRREIEAAASLNHPNVLPLHDSGEAGDLLYFVMPYVEGESLRDRLNREGRLTLKESLEIAGEVGDALAYAHEHGLVHRDVKPENILLQAGHALVCDFGIAQAASHTDERLTRTGVSVGTISYMSPEQFDDAALVDQRADIYALGCILHEMLSGTNPFEAKTPGSALAKKVTGAVPDLTTLRSDVPHTVQAVIERAISVDPATRHVTATEFVGALQTAMTLRAQEADERRRWRRSVFRWAIGAAGAVAVSAVAWWAAQSLDAPRMERIAVLPLRNTVNDTTPDYYMAGFHHDLVVEFAKAVRVINPGSVARYAGTTLSTEQIAEELDVDGVVEGSLTRRPDRVTLDLHLIDRRSLEIVWAGSFESAPGNVVDLYHDSARAIAEEMGVELSPEIQAMFSTSSEVDPQVYDALLQARFQWQKLTATGIDTAEEYYRLAVERDSLSAEAWAGLGTVWHMRAQQGFLSGAEAQERAAPFMRRAEELDPTLAAVQSQRALTLTWSQWRLNDALDAFRMALENDPTDSLVRAYYSQLLLYLNRDDEALAEVERAASLDPFNALVQGVYAQDLIFLKRYAAAEAVLVRARDRDPDAPYLLAMLRTAYHLMGREEEAMEMWRASYRAAGDDEAVAALEDGYDRDGYSEALRAVAELFAARAQTQYVTPWQIATLYTRAGDAEPALENLELAYRDHDQNMLSILVDPIFDFMRNEPRFQALVDSLELPR